MLCFLGFKTHKLKIVRTFKTFINLFKNNNKKLELSSYFQILIFISKVLPPKRYRPGPGTRAPQGPPCFVTDWNTHISKLENKLSCDSGIFHRIRDDLSTNKFKMIYFSLVGYTLIYSRPMPLVLKAQQQNPVLSSRSILNMKRLVTLKYKQTKTSNVSQESDLEACQWFREITKIGMNIETPKSRITEWTEFQEKEVGTKEQLKTRISQGRCIVYLF